MCAPSGPCQRGGRPRGPCGADGHVPTRGARGPDDRSVRQAPLPPHRAGRRPRTPGLPGPHGPASELRRPDPERLPASYLAAREVMGHLGCLDASGQARVGVPVWTSHEGVAAGQRGPDASPAAGRAVAADRAPAVNRRADPAARRRPCRPARRRCEARGLRSRAHDDARTAAGAVRTARLPEAVGQARPHRPDGRGDGGRAVALTVGGRARRRAPGDLADRPDARQPVSAPDGLKSQFPETITREIDEFQHAVGAAGGVAGGLHLETAQSAPTVVGADRGPGDPCRGRLGGKRHRRPYTRRGRRSGSGRIGVKAEAGMTPSWPDPNHLGPERTCGPERHCLA